MHVGLFLIPSSLSFHKTTLQDSFPFPSSKLNMSSNLFYSKDFNSSYIAVIPKSLSVSHTSPLNKFTHPNVHGLPSTCMSQTVPFFNGLCFSERQLSCPVTQIRNLGTILNSSSLAQWLSSVDLILFLPGSFLSLGHDGDDNDLDSYNIFLTGLRLQSCQPSQFIF